MFEDLVMKYKIKVFVGEWKPVIVITPRWTKPARLLGFRHAVFGIKRERLYDFVLAGLICGLGAVSMNSGFSIRFRKPTHDFKIQRSIFNPCARIENPTLNLKIVRPFWDSCV